MKKNVFLIAIFTLLSSVVFSQFYVGGEISFDQSGGSNTAAGTSTDKTKFHNLTFGPMVGFNLSESLSVGGQLVLNNSGNTTDSNNKFRQTVVTIAPFVRYKLISAGPVSVLGQGQIGIGFGGSETTIGGTSSDGPSTFLFIFDASPIISFEISEMFAIEASMGGLNFTSNKQTTTVAGTDNEDVTNNFTLGLDGDLSFGLVVSF